LEFLVKINFAGNLREEREYLKKDVINLQTLSGAGIFRGS
jgi:hypothetical protein